MDMTHPLIQLTQIDVAIVIKLQLTKSGKALNNRVFFLPNLSTIKILIGGASICPTATTATNVEADDAVTGIGESSDINITILGEFHPTMNPMQPLIMEPDRFMYVMYMYGICINKEK